MSLCNIIPNIEPLTHMGVANFYKGCIFDYDIQPPQNVILLHEVIICDVTSIHNFTLSPTPVFFNLFWFTAPYKTETNLRQPYLSKMPIWATLISKKT